MTDPRILEQARALAAVVRRLRQHIIRRHSQIFAETAAGLAPPELTLPQMNMVMVVKDRGTVTIKELAEALSVSAPSASAMVDRLVDLGVLIREQSQVDRRVVEVRVSPGADQHICAMERHILHAIAELLEKIGPEYSEMWCEVYSKIDEVLGTPDAAPAGEAALNKEVAR